MGEATDDDLLTRWHAQRDGAAFTELVHRHIDLVFRAACRQLTIDGHLADDVTQAVFLILSQKPMAAVRASSLPAWLHRTTRYAVANARKMAARRRRHERAATDLRPELTMSSHGPAESDLLLPLLDEAIASLGDADRATIIARYLQGRDIGQVAMTLGATTEAAQKRAERAVVKLRQFFVERGVANATVAGVVGAFASAAADPVSARASLVTRTVAVADGGLTATSASTIIAKGAMSMMIVAKVKLVAFVVIAVATLSALGLQTARTLFAAEAQSTDGVATTAAPATAPALAPAFKAELANGVSVELIGVGENPSIGKPWWRPDGSPLAVAPYARMGGRSFPREGNVAREFAFRAVLRSRATDVPASLRWRVVGAGGWASTGLEDEGGAAVPGLQAFAADPPDRPATVRFEIAAGPWQEVGTMPRPISRTSFANSDVVVAPLRDNGGLIEIDIDAGPTTDEVLADVRVNNVFRAARQTSGNGIVRTFAFDVPRDDITEIRVRRRSFDQWIEFRDVSLHRGPRTQVTIRTTDDQPGALRTRFRNGAVAEVMAIGDGQGGGAWWAPDGSPTVWRPKTPLRFNPDDIAGLPAGDRSLVLAVRWSNVPADAYRTTYFPGVTRYGGTHTGGTPAGEPEVHVFTMPADAAVATVTAATTVEPWTARATAGADGLSAATAARPRLVGAGAPMAGFTRPGATFAVYVDPETIERDDRPYAPPAARVIATDDQGKAHVVNYGSRTVLDDGRTVDRYDFTDAPLTSIVEFRLEQRTCAAADFRNLSLRPGVRTEATVVHGKER